MKTPYLAKMFGVMNVLYINKLTYSKTAALFLLMGKDTYRMSRYLTAPRASICTTRLYLGLPITTIPHAGVRTGTIFHITDFH